MTSRLKTLCLVAWAFFSLSLTAEHRSSNLSEQVARSFIERFPDADVIHWKGQPNHFSWQAGYVMFAMEKLWRMTNDSTYYNYVRAYVDKQVMTDGSVPDFDKGALDNFLPGYACLLLYEQTGEKKYALAAEAVRRGFDDYPRTDEGMFTHHRGTRQVWADGVFMGQIFMARYARTLGHPEDFAEVVRQLKGIEKLCGRSDGLLAHGWAPKGAESWKRGENGQSPEAWSEGMGWVAVLLAEVFDYLPENQEGREELMQMLQRICAGLKAAQDPQTGMWCQVVNRPGAPGNWAETSGTGMFIYLLQSSINKGYIPAKEYQPCVDKAYLALRRKAVANADGHLNLIDCSSIGIQRDYEAYINQPREINTFAAFGSYILGTGIVEHGIRHCLPDEFIASDYSQGKVFRFRGGQIVASYPAPLCNDLWMLPEGSILFTNGQGVVELNAEGDTLFHYQSECHVFACQRLENGNTFVGECEKGNLLEISPKGKVVKRINILPKGKQDGGSAFMRNARRLDNGHYLVAHYGAGHVTEYDQRGRIVWRVETPGGAHSVLRLKNGNTLVAVADANSNPRIVEFNPEKEIVWQLCNDDLAGKPLCFMSGLQYIEGQGLLLTNWQGHGSKAKQPHLLWVTHGKRIRCLMYPHPAIQTLSSVHLLLSEEVESVH
ncbi:MAG: glycoside hydrolase family 88 protein [Bacteroides sp.]|nr:glycoside hydrolase family 88 protein [Bacteroides sp.]